MTNRHNRRHQRSNCVELRLGAPTPIENLDATIKEHTYCLAQECSQRTMPLPHSDVLDCLTGCSDRVPARGVRDRGSEAARERALKSAVASERLCGRLSVFSGRVGLSKTNLTERPPMTNDMMNVRSLVEKSADADPVLFSNDLTARPLQFPSAARHRRMARTPTHWLAYCARSSFDAARSE